MSESTGCPTERQLLELAEGRLEPPLAVSLAAHVEHCDRCTRLLDWIKRRLLRPAEMESAEGKGVSSAASTDGGDKAATHEPLSITRAEGPLDEATFDADLLAPSEHRESLGLLGKYDVLGVLGHGGMGVVFRGLDEQLRRKVALKVMNRSLNSSATARRRFIREARAAAAINHPNVVTIHAVEEHQGVPFLVMEFVNGASLRDRLRERSTLDPIAAIRISAQIASGLAAAHAQGVIHRDIKPGNIMLENGVDRVKITDFGLARAAIDNVELTSRELAVGTPAYMAPEQVNGHDTDPRSDLFSLGCVMYAMIAGHSPFHGKHALEMARKVTDHHPTSLRSLIARVPPFYAEIVHRLLEKNPEKRFQSAQEVADLLNRHLAVINQANSGNLPLALGAPLAASSPIWTRRTAWVTAAAAAMLALCGIAIGMALRRDRAAGERDSTQNPTPTISTNGGESAEPPEPLTGTISVSKSGEAQFRSIREAIWRAGPGATIQVLDEEVYNESLVIDGRDRCRNLQIIAHKQATLMAPSPETVVRIEATPGVVVRGFRMNVHRAQHGVEITGSAAGVRVEDIEAVRTEGDTRRGSTTSNVAFAYVHDGASGTADEPIVLRRIQVRGGLVGVVIGEQSQNAADNVVRWVRLEDSRVLGARPGDGYLFILLGAIEDVSAERNIFANGDCAISFAQLRRARNLAIIDNTFSALNNFFVLGESQPDTEAVAIQSNLILKVNGLAADSQELDSVAAKWFARNWWEIGSANVGDAGKVAQLVGSVPVLSDDPASPDYLKPRADELAKHLKPGEEIPGHARASHSNQGVKQR